jgi:hypothetical protein
VLVVLAAYLIGLACWQVVGALGAEDPQSRILDSIGLIIISFAVMELAKFVFEEEVARKAELRSARESRRSLTKFITIIVIALSLEALVMVFEASQTDLRATIYPATLFAAAVFALIGLGTCQWLSHKVEPSPASDRFETRPQDAGEGGAAAGE